MANFMLARFCRDGRVVEDGRLNESPVAAAELDW